MKPFNRDSRGRFAAYNQSVSNITQISQPKKMVNHYGILLDTSGSTAYVLKHFKELVKKMCFDFSQTSAKYNQEVLYTFYTFSGVYNIRKWNLNTDTYAFFNTLNGDLHRLFAHGGTALIDATLEITDAMMNDRRDENLDHAYLLNVVTDGQENDSTHFINSLKNRLSVLDKTKEWAYTICVPDDKCKRFAVDFGFPEGNIKVYPVTKEGVKEVERAYSVGTQSYVQTRSTGVKSTANYFTTDLSKFNAKELRNKLTVLQVSDYSIYRNTGKEKMRIDKLVESWAQAPYRTGSAYYELVKPEKIQNYKNILVVEKATGLVLQSNRNCNVRELLGLPNYEVLVHPGDHGDYDIFVQSTAPNRNILNNNRVIVLN